MASHSKWKDSDESERTLARGRTSIELAERSDGTWVATQLGVDAEGRGASAALAVKAYGEAIAEDE